MSIEALLIRVMSYQRTKHTTPAISWQERRFIPPLGGYTAFYGQPFEFRMGAYAWPFDLISEGKSVLHEHPAIASAISRLGLHCPTDLAPWSPDGDTLGFIPWHADGPFLYSLSKRIVTQLPVDPGFVVTLKWAPQIPLVLVVQSETGMVFDALGSPRSKSSWPSAPRHHPVAFWWPDSSFYLVLCQPSNSVPDLIAFSPDSGRAIATLRIDPSEMLPYDQDSYKSVPRDGYSLQINQSTRAVGSLLDVWHGSHFDPRSNTLYAATYRPVDAPINISGRTTCVVDEVWASINLAA